MTRPVFVIIWEFNLQKMVKPFFLLSPFAIFVNQNLPKIYFMKKALLLSGVVALALTANAQQLKEGYMEWPDSQKLPQYVNDWTPGTPLFEDENFYISRVKPKARFRNAATQVNEGLNETNDKKLIFWVPVGMVPGGNPNARPNGLFDSEVFSAWSYVTHYGNWSSPHGWVPGNFADVAHKNGVAVSGVASIPYGGITSEWNTALTNQSNLNNEKLAKFLLYHGVDGLGYNSEFMGAYSALAGIRTQHEEIRRYLIEHGNPVAENIWYDGTSDGGMIAFDQGLGDHNKETFGDGEHIRTSLFLNYNWHGVLQRLTQSQVNTYAPGRSALDLYAGFNMQGSNPSTWQSLQRSPLSIGLWGAHDYNMLWAGRAANGSSDLSKQQTYQNHLEMFFTNGNRNPAKPIAVYSGGTHTPSTKWFGMSAFMSARSSLSWDLGEEPFITYFNLGNGRFFNWEGERQNENEWYNIGVQDYMPTWRYWFASSFLGKTAEDVPATGLDAQLTFDDAYMGGSCLRINGSTADEYLHLFKTAFTLQTGDIITVRYKLVSGATDMTLALSATGDEAIILRENNLQVIEATNEADDEIWVEKSFEVGGLLAPLNNKEIAMIALHFTNATNLDLYLGEFSIQRGEFATPAAPEITLAKVLGNNYKGVDAKIIFNMPNDKPVGDPVYNLDVNTSMFKLYAQQEGEEPILMGITTSWAGMYYSIPTNLEGLQIVRLGVSAVSVDFNKDSEITWSEYMEMGEYAISDEIQIDKTTIKPGESFRISYVDPRHAASTWELYKGETSVKKVENSTEMYIEEGISEEGAYDLVIDGNRRINSYVQVTAWAVGALPEIQSLSVSVDGEAADAEAAEVEIKIENELTLGYTGRTADGAASRGVEIDEKWVGVKVGELGLQPYQSFSVSAWVNFSTMPNNSSFFGIEDRTGNWPKNNWGWMWGTFEGSNFSWTFRSPTSTELKYKFPNLVLSPNAWNHVAVVFEYNGSQFRSLFYLNGQLQESTWEFGYDTGTTQDWSNCYYGLAFTDWIAFGGNRGSNAPFNTGIIDELQVWNGAMSQEDVNLSKAGLNANNLPENVIAYWDFDADADEEFYFSGKGSKAGARACVYEMGTGTSEGQGIHKPAQPKYISGTPFIPGSAYKITTTPTWTAKKGVLTEATGNDTEGSVKLTYAKVDDYTVTLTLENTLGYDSKTYPVFTVKPVVAIDNLNADAMRTYVVEDALFVEFTEDGNYHVSVYNAGGIQVAQEAATLTAGQNMRITLNAAGVYVVKVVKDGKETRTIKVMRK